MNISGEGGRRQRRKQGVGRGSVQRAWQMSFLSIQKERDVNQKGQNVHTYNLGESFLPYSQPFLYAEILYY